MNEPLFTRKELIQELIGGFFVVVGLPIIFTCLFAIIPHL